MHKSFALRAAAVCSVLLALSAPATAAGKAEATKLRMTSVTGLPNFACSARDGSPPYCEDVTFEVQAFPIKGPDGVFRGCVAYLPYSSLTINTLKNGLGTTINWAPSDKTITFDKGIVLEGSSSSDHVSDLFDTMTVTSTLVTLPVKGKVKPKKKFKHLPSVMLDVGNGTIIPCDGADPLISNSPN